MYVIEEQRGWEIGIVWFSRGFVVVLPFGCLWMSSPICSFLRLERWCSFAKALGLPPSKPIIIFAFPDLAESCYFSHWFIQHQSFSVGCKSTYKSRYIRRYPWIPSKRAAHTGPVYSWLEECEQVRVRKVRGHCKLCGSAFLAGFC